MLFIVSHSISVELIILRLLKLLVLVLFLNNHICLKLDFPREIFNNGDTIINKFAVYMNSRAIIGEIDEDAEKTIDLPAIRAEPLNAITH